MNDPQICPRCNKKYPDTNLRFCTVDGAGLLPAEAVERIGAVLGDRYELQKLLRRGTRCVVYSGQNTVFGKPVAIKVLPASLSEPGPAAGQFVSQAQLAAMVQHPNVIDVIDTGRTPDGALYQVLELLQGRTLERALGRDGRVPLFDAVNIIRQLTHALEAVHDAGLLHLNLQPRSVFLVPQQGRRQTIRRDRSTGRFSVEREENFLFVKLKGFGRALELGEDGAASANLSGLDRDALQFQAPERMTGKVDRRSDIYSLGLLLYLMVTGEMAFDGPPVPGATPVPPGWRAPDLELPRDTNSTIMRCLECEPERRFQSVDELLPALDDCFTNRVFLRNAHRLEGAVESGLVPDDLIK